MVVLTHDGLGFGHVSGLGGGLRRSLLKAPSTSLCDGLSVKCSCFSQSWGSGGSIGSFGLHVVFLRSPPTRLSGMLGLPHASPSVSYCSLFFLFILTVLFLLPHCPTDKDDTFRAVHFYLCSYCRTFLCMFFLTASIDVLSASLYNSSRMTVFSRRLRVFDTVRVHIRKSPKEQFSIFYQSKCSLVTELNETWPAWLLHNEIIYFKGEQIFSPYLAPEKLF